MEQRHFALHSQSDTRLTLLGSHHEHLIPKPTTDSEEEARRIAQRSLWPDLVIQDITSANILSLTVLILMP